VFFFFGGSGGGGYIWRLRLFFTRNTFFLFRRLVLGARAGTNLRLRLRRCLGLLRSLIIAANTIEIVLFIGRSSTRRCAGCAFCLSLSLDGASILTIVRRGGGGLSPPSPPPPHVVVVLPEAGEGPTFQKLFCRSEFVVCDYLLLGLSESCCQRVFRNCFQGLFGSLSVGFDGLDHERLPFRGQVEPLGVRVLGIQGSNRFISASWLSFSIPIALPCCPPSFLNCCARGVSRV